MTVAPTLECACTALWSATLSLMAAYLHNAAPAHRLLLARRIAANFQTLSQQEVYSAANRESFGRLHSRWHDTALALARPPRAESGGGWRQGLTRAVQSLL